MATSDTTNSNDSDTVKDIDDAVYHWFDDRGYSKVGDGDSFAYLHRLLACVDHNPYEVYSPGKQVHHETGFKADNRCDSISVRTRAEHSRLHNRSDWTEVNGEPRLQMVEPALSKYGVNAD